MFIANFHYKNEKYIIEFTSWSKAFQYIKFFTNLCGIKIIPFITKQYYKKILTKRKGSLTFTETNFQMKFMYKKN